MDEDGDGFITVEDMKKGKRKKYFDEKYVEERLLRMIGNTFDVGTSFKDLGEKEIEQMFLLLDDDGDGKISFTGTFS